MALSSRRCPRHLQQLQDVVQQQLTFTSEALGIEARAQFRSPSEFRYVPPNSETRSLSWLSAATKSSQRFVTHQSFSPRLTATGAARCPCDVLRSLPRHLGKGQPMTFSNHHLFMFILALRQVCFQMTFVEETWKTRFRATSQRNWEAEGENSLG